MANIQNPNGFEANETIDGVNDIMHIFQPGSSGVRRNKRIILNTLKAFFQIITGGTQDNIVTIGSSEEIQDSGVAVADIGLNNTHRGSDGKNHSDVVSNTAATALNTTHRSSDGKNHSDVVSNTAATALNTTHRSSDGSDHSFIDQDVKSTAGPTFIDGKRLVTSANYLYDSTNEDVVFDKLSPFIPDVGNEMMITGGFKDSGGITYILSRAKKESSSVIKLYCITIAGSVSAIDMVDGQTGHSVQISASW